MSNEHSAAEYTKSYLELQALQQIMDAELPKPEREFEGIPERRFRFDFAWPEHLIAVEIHGATHVGKGHTGGVGFTKDRQKMNLAAVHGWIVLEFTAEMLNADELVPTLKELFALMAEYEDGQG